MDLPPGAPAVLPGGIDLGSIDRLSRQLRRREVSALELARIALDGLSTTGTKLNAVAALLEERAVREARRADRALRADSAGPLCGIPYGVKDVIAAGGAPTRWGSPTRSVRDVEPDAAVVHQLERAGAVLVAKLATVALAGAGGYRSSAASIHGPARNPWDPARYSGGSSTGPAIAVSAGLLPFALATETGASICGPAALCGVSGMRPTYGSVSNEGVMTLAWTMDTVGPMAHDARGCAAVLRAITRPGIAARRPGGRGPEYGRRRLRVGVVTFDFERYPATAAPFAAVLSVLFRLGTVARPVSLPERDLLSVYAALLKGETAASQGGLARDGSIELLPDPVQRAGLRAAGAMPAADYVLASRAREALSLEIHRLFKEIDVLIAPTVHDEAPLLDQPLDGWRVHHGHTVLGAVTGVPAMSVPMGFGRNGLPVGLMLVGDRHGEPTLLRLATALQRSTSWHRSRPPGYGGAPRHAAPTDPPAARDGPRRP